MKTEYFESHNNIISILKKTPELYDQYKQLSEPWNEQFLAFMDGTGFLPLTYDPFFKRIFHPDIHKERLEDFVSSLLNMKVTVKAILSNEDSLITGDTLLIMDLLVELEDGSLVNVEIQRQPYLFPAQRISCYSADLLLRQYVRVKGEKGKNFTYQDVKKVYVIVIYQKSTKEFHDCGEQYIHHGSTVFDTNLDLPLLQEYYLVALDVFRKNMYSIEKNHLTAWLSLLASDNIQDVEKVISDYPWLKEIYQEVAMLRNNPKEVLGMWSEALRILDRNTLQYYIDQLKQQDDEKKAVIEQQLAEIAQHEETMTKQAEVLAQQKETMSKQAEALAQQEAALVLKDKKIAELERLLAEK